MGITTAIAAKAYGIPLTPIPVFTVRRFDYETMFYNIESGIDDPSQLNGRTVAVRSPNVTVDILCSAMLADCYGVDLGSIHWIVVGDNHIAEATLPPNSELRPGADLGELVESGEATAIFGGYRGSSPLVRPLIADLPALEQRCFELFGSTTVHHTVVIKNDALAANPGLAEALFDAFNEAKQPFLRRINDGEDVWEDMVAATPMGPRHDYGIERQSDLRLPDPVPYGLENNRGMLESLMRAAHANNYLPRVYELEEIFA